MQQLSLIAAGLAGMAPLVAGLVRGWTSSDYTLFWVALIPWCFTAGVLATTIGRRRSRQAIRNQTLVIFVVSTLLAAVTSYLFGATAPSSMWGASVIFGLLFAASSALVGLARTQEH